MKQVQYTLCLGAAFFTCLLTGAQENTVNLDPVTVTSTISAVASSKTGRNIVVIGGDRFKSLPVNSIDELLRYVPGVEVQSRGPMGAQSDIVIRGGTFQQVLVILDGIRLNDPITGHFNSYIPLSPFEIERIEILKGASSAIYGSEAVGGVVHIITKTFASKEGTTKKEAAASLAAGKYNLINAQIGGFHHKGKTAVGGGFLTNNATGAPQRGGRGYFNLHTASLSASHFISPQMKIAIRSSYDDRSFAAQNFYTSFVSDTATEQVRSSWNHLNLTYQKQKNRLSFDAGYKAVSDHYAFNPRAVANDNKSNLGQLLIQNEHRINSKVIVNAGLQFINRKIKSNDRGNHQETQAALFTLLQYSSPSGLN
ncbi:MAG: TonB-dependent receptor plug domain-containing protein, partial [Chitinophagaceae bacterium]